MTKTGDETKKWKIVKGDGEPDKPDMKKKLEEVLAAPDFEAQKALIADNSDLKQYVKLDKGGLDDLHILEHLYKG